MILRPNEDFPPAPALPEEPVLRSQAQRVIDRFGGPVQLAKALAAIGSPRHASNVTRWTYSRKRGGTGGLIPGSAMPLVIQAARYHGVFLTPQDTDPRPSP